MDPRLPIDNSPPGRYNLRNWNDRDEYTARNLEDLGHARAAAFFRSQRQERLMLERNENARVMEGRFIVGQFVKKKNHNKRKLEYPWTGPYIITEILQNDVYRLALPSGETLSNPIHQDELAPYSATDASQESDRDEIELRDGVENQYEHEGDEDERDD